MSSECSPLHLPPPLSSRVNDNEEAGGCDNVDADRQTDFFTPSSAFTGITAGAANATLNAQADVMCPAFAWADVGIMGGLWLILLVAQGYFIL